MILQSRTYFNYEQPLGGMRKIGIWGEKSSVKFLNAQWGWGREGVWVSGFCHWTLLFSTWSFWERRWFSSKMDEIPCGNQLILFSKMSRKGWNDCLLSMNSGVLSIVAKYWNEWIGICESQQRNMKLTGRIFLHRVWFDACRSSLQGLE